MSALIKITNLTKDYVNDDVVTPVLRGLNFAINQGEFVAIMGPSGSGKSTLMHILGFLDRLTNGVYEFDLKNVAEFSDNELAGLRNQEVGFVFQSYNLLPKTSVIENVKLPLIYAGLSPREMQKKAEKTIEAVGLTHRLNHLSNQLSGGESQRVAIARALINEPKMIFADEPTGNLDSKAGEIVLKILQELNEQGTTILMVTHELEAAEFAKRIIRMRDGVVKSNKLSLSEKPPDFINNVCITKILSGVPLN